MTPEPGAGIPLPIAAVGMDAGTMMMVASAQFSPMVTPAPHRFLAGGPPVRAVQSCLPADAGIYLYPIAWRARPEAHGLSRSRCWPDRCGCRVKPKFFGGGARL